VVEPEPDVLIVSVHCGMGSNSAVMVELALSVKKAGLSVLVKSPL
jgi:hypothetical protein